MAKNYRNGKPNRRARRYRVIKIRRFILAVIVIALIALLAIFGVKHLLANNTGYNSENGFIKYSDSLFKSIDGDMELYEPTKVQEYGEPMSFATNLPTTGYEDIDKAVADKWASDKKNFEEDNQTVAQGNQVALVAGYEASGTPYDAEGLAIHTFHYEKIDKEESLSEEVDCYNIATKTGGELTLSQMFYGDYESVFKEEAETFLTENYKDNLTEDYTSKIDTAIENFILTEAGVRFFWNSGTVVTADQGAIAMTIPYGKFDGVIRDDIGKRIIDPSKPMIALTYDDGPSVDDSTDRILNVLEEYDAVATFFELGERVDEEGDRGAKLLQRELQLGCEVGSHSYSHPNLYELSTDGIENEAQKSIDAITNATGQPPTVTRPPYGNGSDEIAQIFGLPSVNWNIDTLDWQSRNADAVVEVVQGSGNLDGCIVLMHSIYSSSAEATERLVPWLQEQGYQFVTVSELLQYKYGHTPIENKHYGYYFDQPDGESDGE
ncbi:MAG: polysaccharide deacetylase family protein [Firmicutes bacterium]|nr:polysaccharide deacetylase family protein [Bacillota bacterium]